MKELAEYREKQGITPQQRDSATVQLPVMTEKASGANAAPTTATEPTASPKLSSAKKTTVQQVMQELEAYREKQGITPQQRDSATVQLPVMTEKASGANAAPAVSSNLPPVKQTAVNKVMQELEVYRRERGIEPQQRSAPTPSSAPSTVHDNTRQRSTNSGENAFQADVPTPQNKDSLLDTSLRGDYNKNGVDSKRTTSLAEWLRFPEQTHHFASDKNKKYTPMFESIVLKYGLDLDGEWNKEKMHHLGRHPDKYHKWVYRCLKMIDKIAKGDVSKFQLEFENIKRYIRDNPMLLRKKGWDE